MKSIVRVNVQSILEVVKEICQRKVLNTQNVADMTVGNGNDTLMLSNLAKHVYGFDVQKQAIQNTRHLLDEHKRHNYSLFLMGHENVDKVLNKSNDISLFLFNLGYLPKGDKTVTTLAATTLEAIQKSLNIINDKGTILVVFYPHPEGVNEAKLAKSYLEKENIDYIEYHNTDNTNAPYLVEIQKDYAQEA